MTHVYLVWQGRGVYGQDILVGVCTNLKDLAVMQAELPMPPFVEKLVVNTLAQPYRYLPKPNVQPEESSSAWIDLLIGKHQVTVAAPLAD